LIFDLGFDFASVGTGALARPSRAKLGSRPQTAKLALIFQKRADKFTQPSSESSNSGKSKGWEMALERAENALYRNKAQASRLRAAIRLFREKIALREPWLSDGN
jgi:hypothetical protein